MWDLLGHCNNSNTQNKRKEYLRKQINDEKKKMNEILSNQISILTIRKREEEQSRNVDNIEMQHMITEYKQDLNQSYIKNKNNQKKLA